MGKSLRKRFGTPEKEMRLRVICAPMGPGKARLLEWLEETQSINQAARHMGMTYARVWGILEELNEGFTSPLVHSTAGGRHGGGTELTGTGREVLRLYRLVEEKAAAAAADELQALQALVKPPE